MSENSPLVVFVCTGNTCRSPMAEVMMRQLLDQRHLPDVDVASAGLFASDGSPASANSAATVREHGLSLDDFRSQRLSPDLVAQACDIVPMTHGHLSQIQAMFPDQTGKCRTLRSIIGESGDIIDPFGGPLSEYQDTLAAMVPALTALADEIAAR